MKKFFVNFVLSRFSDESLLNEIANRKISVDKTSIVFGDAEDKVVPGEGGGLPLKGSKIVPGQGSGLPTKSKSIK